MEASGIPKEEQANGFKHCLEGKVRVWYDEIDVLEDWDDLMDLFCKQFCIYG